uniref:Col_cuticle_N domain-containing protein n=1 Tax=Steinernema glaseri TaxID=37863 RepID=A0A1I7ZFI2_9BILA
MRLLVRLGLAACAVVFLLICFAISKVSRTSADDDSDETDEAVRILLLADTGNGAADGIQNTPPKITFNVAVVLVVSLLSVVLLITGIIVLAVTLDPNSHNDDEDDDLENYADDYGANSFRSMWFEAHSIADISDDDDNDPKVSMNEL